MIIGLCLWFVFTVRVYGSCLRFVFTVRVYGSCLRFVFTVRVYGLCLRFVFTVCVYANVAYALLLFPGRRAAVWSRSEARLGPGPPGLGPVSGAAESPVSSGTAAVQAHDPGDPDRISLFCTGTASLCYPLLHRIRLAVLH